MGCGLVNTERTDDPRRNSQSAERAGSAQLGTTRNNPEQPGTTGDLADTAVTAETPGNPGRERSRVIHMRP
jgi:hypothetical protein